MKEYFLLLLRHKGADAAMPVLLGYALLSLANCRSGVMYAGEPELIRAFVAENFQLVGAVLRQNGTGDEAALHGVGGLVIALQGRVRGEELGPVGPVLAGWWPILFYSSFIDRPGNELFFLYFPARREALCPLGIEAAYLAAVSLYFLAIRGIYELPLSFLGVLAGEIFFISGLVFFLIQLTRSTGIALGMSVIYCVYLTKFDRLEIFQFLSIFSETAAWSEDVAGKLGGALCFGAAFHIAGFAILKKRRVFF